MRDRFLALGFTTDVVLTSVLPRAVETAQILAPALGDPEVEQDCDLCELHPGDADGMPWDEYRTRFTVVPHETPDQPFSPGGETLREFEQRAERGLADVLHRYGDQRVVIISHGGFISAVCLQLLGARITEPRGFLLAPALTSITIWSTSDERVIGAVLVSLGIDESDVAAWLDAVHKLRGKPGWPECPWQTEALGVLA